MAKLGYCNVRNLKLSSRSIAGVRDIKSIMESGNLFVYAVGAVPLFDLFLDPESAQSRLVNIAAYDWVEFSAVLMAANKIVKERIRGVAAPLQWQTYGEEGEFWRCVSDAAL